jgi:hypothetical protein
MKAFVRVCVELFAFFVEKRKAWLLPIVFIFIIIGGLFIATQGTVVAPLIYTLF